MILFLFCPLAAGADDLASTGSELFGQCLLYTEISPMPWAKKVTDYNESIRACLSYMDEVIVKSKSEKATREYNYCLPEGITNGQLAALYVHFGGNYPKLINTDADGAVNAVLEKAYPCN